MLILAGSVGIIVVIALGTKSYKQYKIIDYGPCDQTIYSLDAKATTVIVIYADQGFYKENFTPERIYRGVLSEMPNKEDENYPIPLAPGFFRPFILRQESGGEIPLYRWDTKDQTLSFHLGWHVEICGKYVKANRQGGEPTELWPGYLVPLTPPSH